jgi:hypothetical protein
MESYACNMDLTASRAWRGVGVGDGVVVVAAAWRTEAGGVRRGEKDWGRGVGRKGMLMAGREFKLHQPRLVEVRECVVRIC